MNSLDEHALVFLGACILASGEPSWSGGMFGPGHRLDRADELRVSQCVDVAAKFLEAAKQKVCDEVSA